MAWEKGFSYTKGYTATTVNPDGSEESVKVHGGLFFWLPIDFGKRRLEIYAGFRPTPTWSLGVGNEGVIPAFKRLMWKWNMANFGLCLRIKKG